jgi:Chitinase
MTAKSTALALTDPAPVPMFGGAAMAAAFRGYQDLQHTLDQAMPDQVIRIEGRPFRKKGYWRGVGIAFNLTVTLLEERRDVHGTFEDGHDNFGYVAVYQATAPNGRSAIGDGACFAVEKALRRIPNKWIALPFQATEHNIRSHAHTRAFNRAISNLVGFGEVSAEELERDDDDVRAAIAQEPARPPDVELPPAPPRSPRYQDPDAKPITDPQRRKLFATAKAKWPDTDALKAVLYLAFGIQSTKDLRMGDYEQALAIVTRGPRPIAPTSEVP